MRFKTGLFDSNWAIITTDMALLLEDIRTATELLHRVESSAANMRLFINVGKTKIMTLNLGHLVGDLQRSH